MSRSAFALRCVKRAARQTGWFSPFRDFLPALAVATATFFVTVRATPPGQGASPVLIGLPLAAGVVALVVSYVLINTAEFAAHLIDAPKQLRIADEAERQAAVDQLGEDQAMKQWLTLALGDPRLGVRFAAAFGAVVRADPTRDVDVLVQVAAPSNRELRRKAMQVKALARPFRDAYRKQLHVQLFSDRENASVRAFLARAGEFEVLVGYL
jgi:hypothetical protein